MDAPEVAEKKDTYNNGNDDQSAGTEINQHGLNEDDALKCPPETTDLKLMTKIDLHVVPVLCLMYLMAFLDRVNIGNANVYGLSEELGLDKLKYNTALVIFFVPYCLFEIPSNMLLKKFRPSTWLTLNMFGFGLVMTLQGVVQNYGGLLATRFFLGVFETGMFPGCFYIIGMWYRRAEAQRRYSFFFNSTTLAGAFGGLLAAAIGNMNGVRGYAGWRWVFIIEGLFTIVCSFFLYFVMPEFPEKAKWLTDGERKYVAARIAAEQGDAQHDRKITLKDVGNFFKDWKLVIGGLMYFGLIIPAYSYAYFSPSIIHGYGYSAIQAQLYSVPPWAAAFGFSMILAFISDRTRHRVSYALFAICVAITGFGILMTVRTDYNLQYGALFLVTMGSYTAMPLIVCWYNMNLGGHIRRSIGSAWQVGFGNLGGIVASFAFPTGDAPKYVLGYSLCMSFVLVSFVTCLIYCAGCWYDNRKKDREAAENNGETGLTEQEKADMGDKSPDYRYLM